ncbi:MAG: NigD-like N-terminal domain-containing protein [Prolixibacteraceae bacterium]|nr:NigD-like N-terminal domain-containing protein [Prolixibacteraceae bacterium]MBN2650241.1 NigD-like N-terminal domain-containing protein [Prolixibacteraceae bacterium]
MRRGIFFTGVLLILLSLISSCSDDNDYYSVGEYGISLGLIDTTNTFGYDYLIRCDNGDSLLPAITAFYGYKPTHKQRVLVNFSPLDKVGDSKKLLYAKINNLSDVLYKEIIEATEANADSLGNDPVIIDDIWLSNGILNIEFRVWGNVRTHFINLSYVPNEQEDIDEPIELTFRHNRNDDDENYLLYGLVSFDLSKLQQPDSDSIAFRIISTDYNGKSHTNSGTYIYGDGLKERPVVKSNIQHTGYSLLSE